MTERGTIEEELRLLRLALEELRVQSAPPIAVSYQEAARMLSVSLETIRRMVSRGEVRSVVIGARPRIPMLEITRLVASGVAASRRIQRRTRPSTVESMKLRVALGEL